jgi:COPI associated protein
VRSFFGIMMICVELNIANLQPRIKSQFGFLFTFYGRATFILFAATMCLARGGGLAYAVGALTVVDAVFNTVVICIHPAWRRGGRFYKAEVHESYMSAEKAAAAYVRNNPELAAKAAQSAARYAAENPETARQIASGAARGVADSQSADQSDRNPF